MEQNKTKQLFNLLNIFLCNSFGRGWLMFSIEEYFQYVLI